VPVLPEDLAIPGPGLASAVRAQAMWSKHWHGGTATTAMAHIAVQEALDGKAVEWMEHVTDEQYGAGTNASSRTQP